jgi:hypothetical protein
MRLRHRRRILKYLRCHRDLEPLVRAIIAGSLRSGLSFTQAIETAILAPNASPLTRAGLAMLLERAGAHPLQSLLHLFFDQTEKSDLYATALTLEALNDRRAVPPLIQALLHDPNPHRRHAAARALGWIRQPGRAAAQALAQCLADPTQPQPAREEAAESLAYACNRETVDALIGALRDPDVCIRFWAAFGLSGRQYGHDPRATAALESVLHDAEAPPGGSWWSVGREALAVLARKPIPNNPYKARLQDEAARILTDPGATPADRRWAECYLH